METESKNNEIWRKFLTGEMHDINKVRQFFSYLPSSPRCVVCNAPFGGIGGPVMRFIYKKVPSRRNPKFCNICERLAQDNPGGAEVELTMMFADVRGSTILGESLAPAEFRKQLNRFYKIASDALVRTDAMIDKLVGDEVIGLYIVGIAGSDHAKKALSAAREILAKTGHDSGEHPWLPVGVGIHTGTAFVGAIGSEEHFTDMTALGDAMNTAARIVGAAGPGEILMSEEAYRSAGISEKFEERSLVLKGKAESVPVRVIKI